MIAANQPREQEDQAIMRHDLDRHEVVRMQEAMQPNASAATLRRTEAALVDIMATARAIASRTEEVLRQLSDGGRADELDGVVLQSITLAVPALLHANHEQLRSIQTMLHVALGRQGTDFQAT
jgi:hypothetical protein